MADAGNAQIRSADAYEAVRAALCDFMPREPVSTAELIRLVRSIEPGCQATDADLVDALLRVATGRTICIAFDHVPERSPAEPTMSAEPARSAA